MFYVEFTVFNYLSRSGFLSILFTERECVRLIFMSDIQCLFYLYNVLLALQHLSFLYCLIQHRWVELHVCFKLLLSSFRLYHTICHPHRVAWKPPANVICLYFVRLKINLVLSCLSCLVSSRLVSSRLVSSRLLSSHLISSHIAFYPQWKYSYT